MDIILRLAPSVLKFRRLCVCVCFLEFVHFVFLFVYSQINEFYFVHYIARVPRKRERGCLGAWWNGTRGEGQRLPDSLARRPIGLCLAREELATKFHFSLLNFTLPISSYSF